MIGNKYIRKVAAQAASAILALSLSGGVAGAGPLEDGIAAYEAREFEAAVGLWRPLAEGGDVEAQFLLGFVFGEGQGVEKNPVEAVRWFGLAGQQGHAPSQNRLGLIFAIGDGVEEDEVEAVKWFRMAAEQGHSDAQLSMGVHYDSGDGVSENKEEAYAWATISAAQGNMQASRFKLVLESEIPTEVMDRGLILAQKYWDLYVVPFQN